MSVDYALVLTHHPDYAGRLWGMTDNDYATLVMHDAGPKPTKATLDSKWAAVSGQREIDAVRDERARLYREESDGLYFEAQRGEGSVTLDDWKAAVQAIKDSHPWPS
jgi:hypothetical protein